MRTQVIAGHTVLTVTYEDEDGDKNVVNLVKFGRRVRVTTSSVTYIRPALRGEPPYPGWLPAEKDEIDKNVEVGPKTLARVIEDALVYGHSNASKVDSDYGDQPLKFERAGTKRVKFDAPCGQFGFITNNEATKLIAALRTL